jgi:hypothetical protein
MGARNKTFEARRNGVSGEFAGDEAKKPPSPGLPASLGDIFLTRASRAVGTPASGRNAFNLKHRRRTEIKAMDE